MEEIEIKFLDVDVASLEEKLKKIGAKKVGEYFYKRRTFDYPDLRLDKGGVWIRVRDEGDRVTMACKKIVDYDPSVKVSKNAKIEEHEVIVSDFDTTCQILSGAGLIEKGYQENKRLRYVKDDIEYDIDTWPKIPTFLEIEGPSLEKVEEAARLLDFDVKESVRYSSWQIYQSYGIELHNYQIVTFDKWVKK
jgi:adenylate cyclase class 2